MLKGGARIVGVKVFGAGWVITYFFWRYNNKIDRKKRDKLKDCSSIDHHLNR